VPPEYATVSGLPLSFTVKSMDNVPGVWPGVVTMVTVVSPSVIFWPSSATLSLWLSLGVPVYRLLDGIQSGPPMTMCEPNRSCIILAPPT
jgi:hypothetical protein